MSIMSRVRHIELLLEELYDEYIDSFTYMMEQPYTFHYFCEMYHSELYEEYLTLKENINECLVFV